MTITNSIRDASKQKTDAMVVGEALNRFGAQCETAWLSDRKYQLYSSDFLEKGYHVIDLDNIVTQQIADYFADTNVEPLRIDDRRDDYVCAKIDLRGIADLNAQNLYYATPSQPVVDALDELFEGIADEVERQLAHPWAITNVRAWGVLPNADYGSNTWHTDGGFSRYLRKLLIFPTPTDLELGTIEFVTRSGQVQHLERQGPVALLIDVASLAHRGRPPLKGVRPTIEVTIAPARTTSPRCVFAGQLSKVPLDCAGEISSQMAALRFAEGPQRLGKRIKRHARQIAKASVSYLKSKSGSRKRNRRIPAVTNLTNHLNLGGGRRFAYKGWINLEAVPSASNPFPFEFTPETILPVATSSVGLVFSSHCFEHLNDETVARLLSESRRVLRSDGKLLLKLPDFDKVLKSWQTGDTDFIFNTCRLDKVVVTWGSKMVEDTIDSRAAFIFCGFWNSAFGHNFYGNKGKKLVPEAYLGPPVQIAEMAEELKAMQSPHAIAVALREKVLATETNFTFNHQNGWGRTELAALLAEHGFEVQSFDADAILEECSHVPRLAKSRDISFYCLATPIANS